MGVRPIYGILVTQPLAMIIDVSGLIDKFNVHVKLAIIARVKNINSAF